MALHGQFMPAEDKKMGEAAANPVYIGLLCIARCLVPLAILFGVSYLLRRFGLIAKPTQPSVDYENNEDDGY